MDNNSSRTGVILAAGFGSRLKGTVEDIDLKPLTPVAGVPLIYRVIESLEKAGCEHIVIVLGHGYEEIKKEIEEGYTGSCAITYVFNEEYQLKNGVSLLSSGDLIEDEFILVMADHVVSDSVMQQAKDHQPPKQGATLLVDYKLESIFDMDDATKVLARENRLISIGKQIEDYNCIDTGVFVCTRGLLDELENVYNNQGNASISEGVQRLAEQDRMQVLDIGDGFWQDVDTPEMREHAEKILNEEETISY